MEVEVAVVQNIFKEKLSRILIRKINVFKNETIILIKDNLNISKFTIRYLCVAVEEVLKSVPNDNDAPKIKRGRPKKTVCDMRRQTIFFIKCFFNKKISNE
ncbi:hypothetical protein BpHYR1_043351 [Brachionus plicatilis]|uniref:Uncharacterized protein n=1 Tax=Brachionus plicatilis TaxID=10195 RepID=A0A3M7RMN6_BRAPC|nr:hypothetical protein BpHYR1_043351 [Brachionus plicatilis]